MVQQSIPLLLSAVSFKSSVPFHSGGDQKSYSFQLIMRLFLAIKPPVGLGEPSYGEWPFVGGVSDAEEEGLISDL